MNQTTIGLRAAVNSHSRNSVMSEAVSSAASNGRLPTEDELREIAASLRGLRFGSVSIVVQDGVIIQIDRTEKKRLRTRREVSDPAKL